MPAAPLGTTGMAGNILSGISPLGIAAILTELAGFQGGLPWISHLADVVDIDLPCAQRRHSVFLSSACLAFTGIDAIEELMTDGTLK